MAWSRNNSITATALNDFNRQQYVGFETNHDGTTLHNFIYHGSSGLFFSYRVGNGWGSSPWMCVDKLVNGSWVECYAKQDKGWGANWGDNVYMQNINNPGPGQWRIRFISSQSGTSNWGIYPYQQDCTSGRPLTIWPQWDGSYSDTSVSIGTLIDASILNTGRVGTI